MNWVSLFRINHLYTYNLFVYIGPLLFFFSSFFFSTFFFTSFFFHYFFLLLLSFLLSSLLFFISFTVLLFLLTSYSFSSTNFYWLIIVYNACMYVYLLTCRFSRMSIFGSYQYKCTFIHLFVHVFIF